MAMTALLVVLITIIAGINAANYSNIVHEADALLEFLSENKGHFPPLGKPRETIRKADMSPEIPFETRFFSVLLSNTGEALLTETGSIAAIGEDQAIVLAKEVFQLNASRGFRGDYRYIRITEDDRYRIIFLDCGRKLESFKGFLLASCMISLTGYILFSMLMIFFSNRIVKPIAESYQKQKRFITDAGHELKTPLTIITADADVLETEIGENEWLVDIQRQAKRLASLTGDLIALAKMEEVQVTQMILFPFSELISETVSSFMAPAQAHGKTIAVDIQPMLSLKGNEAHIQRLINILMDNAIKYSPQGACIQISVRKYGKTIRLSVSNPTLTPLTVEDTIHLFDRFYRADPSRNSESGGYGIGLSLAEAIITTHGGKVQAITANKGTELQILVQFPSYESPNLRTS